MTGKDRDDAVRERLLIGYGCVAGGKGEEGGREERGWCARTKGRKQPQRLSPGFPAQAWAMPCVIWQPHDRPKEKKKRNEALLAKTLLKRNSLAKERHTASERTVKRGELAQAL